MFSSYSLDFWADSVLNSNGVTGSSLALFSCISLVEGRERGLAAPLFEESSESLRVASLIFYAWRSSLLLHFASQKSCVLHFSAAGVHQYSLTSHIKGASSSKLALQTYLGSLANPLTSNFATSIMMPDLQNSRSQRLACSVIFCFKRDHILEAGILWGYRS